MLNMVPRLAGVMGARGLLRTFAACVLAAASCNPLPRFTGPLADLADRVVRRPALRACSEIPSAGHPTILQQGRGPFRNCVQQQRDTVVGLYLDSDGKVLELTISVSASDSAALTSTYKVHQDSLIRQLGTSHLCPLRPDSSFSPYEYWSTASGFVRLYMSPGLRVTWQHGLGTGFCD